MEKYLAEKCLDKKEYICESFIDLPKAFDTISHGLLQAKLGATKTVNVRVWQDFTDGPLLLNLFINLTECSCHVAYAFESESTLYSCLSVKELLARSRREI